MSLRAIRGFFRLSPRGSGPGPTEKTRVLCSREVDLLGSRDGARGLGCVYSCPRCRITFTLAWLPGDSEARTRAKVIARPPSENIVFCPRCKTLYPMYGPISGSPEALRLERLPTKALARWTFVYERADEVHPRTWTGLTSSYCDPLALRVVR
jgi:uncharacterized C2H2 Zn-finger protein